MNRRGFFKQVGVGGAATAATVVVAKVGMVGIQPVDVDDFQHNGYRVKWRGWSEAVNQNIVCGMWLAKHETQDQEWVSTSLGQCYPSRAWEVVDMTKAEGWPKLTIFSSDAEKAVTKERALQALLAVL